MSIMTPVGTMEEIEGNKVVKWFPEGASKASAETELHKTVLVREYGLDAPFAHRLVERSGRYGVEYDRVIGPTFTQWIIEHPNWLRRLTEFFAHEHHEVHMHKVPELPRLKDLLSEAVLKRKDLDEEVRNRLEERIKAMPDGEWLCHMGFSPESMMISIDGPVVFDWGGAVRGDYLADVAMTSLLLERWTPRAEEREAVEGFKDMFRFGYTAEYIKICGRGDDELEAWRSLLAPLL